MRSVSIIGAGMTKFGEHWDASFRDLIVEAGVKAVTDAGVAGKDLQAIYGGCMASGRFIGQEHIGALIADQLGLNPLPSTRLEAACASGSVALRAGYMAVASGMYDVVAVGGVEKMTEVSTEEAAIALGGAGDQEWELFNGATFPALYALMAQRHMLEYGTTEEQLASASVKNHANGVHNPYAQFQRAITIDDVMNSGYVATPLKLLDCSPITDGAAAVILCASERAKEFNDTPIEIAGSGQASDTLALANRSTLTAIPATTIAAKQALSQAKVDIKDIDLAEVHDCFSIAEIMAIEDLGFFKKGTGGKASADGETAIGSKIPINTSGGLKACGHPVGATGVKQVIELYWQLRGEATNRQVDGAEIGLAQNVGGSGATAVVHVLKRY
ncbi:acetyl-CoA acetyltransferase [Candidatus Micrarchaeota archaeon CG1_02_55_22]|nr:MAG: acetyl-CoA acetyltransferase [Candidatus Micrarchaeota archaeon CG1_02_55_22]